jgi:hypothetical protein
VRTLLTPVEAAALLQAIEQLGDGVDPYDAGPCTETAQDYVEGFRLKVLELLRARLR